MEIMSDHLKLFFKFWDKGVEEGVFSKLTGEEVHILEIYDGWKKETEEKALEEGITFEKFVLTHLERVRDERVRVELRLAGLRP